MRKFLTALMLTASTAFIVDAQPRKPAASGQPQIVEATKQFNKIRANGSTFMQYRAVIVWNAGTAPSSEFFFRMGNEWKETSLSKPERRSFGAGGPNDYMMVEKHVEPSAIKPGDKLTLTSHRHEHDEEEMPAAVKKMNANGLYYAVGKGSNQVWKVVPITFKALPDRVQ